jgi:hypothetical protein
MSINKPKTFCDLSSVVESPNVWIVYIPENDDAESTEHTMLMHHDILEDPAGGDFETIDESEMLDVELGLTDNLANVVWDFLDMVRMDGIDVSDIVADSAKILDDAYWAIARQIAQRADQELLKAINECYAQKADGASDNVPVRQPQSVDDILFERIQTEPEKKPAPPSDTDDYCY